MFMVFRTTKKQAVVMQGNKYHACMHDYYTEMLMKLKSARHDQCLIVISDFDTGWTNDVHIINNKLVIIILD